MRGPLRIGALACSSIARRQILPVLAGDEDFDLRCVASRSLERATAFAEAFGTRGCTYEELLADPSVEAVYVSVPVGLHARWGRAVLEAGKHLLVEKTATADLASLTDLMQVGSERQLIVMEALAYVFHPLHDQLSAMLKEKRLGCLQQLEACFTIPARPPGDIRLDPSLGGGALLDMAVYPLSFCLHMVGSLPVRWDLICTMDETGVDRRGVCQLEWRDCSAQVSFGFGLYYRNEIRLQGDCGCIEVDRVFTRPPDYTGGVEWKRDGRQVTVAVPAANAYARMLRHFAQRIEGCAVAGPNEGSDLRQRMGLIDELRQSEGYSELW